MTPEDWAFWASYRSNTTNPWCPCAAVCPPCAVLAAQDCKVPTQKYWKMAGKMNSLNHHIRMDRS